jgi:hypothetical protein
MVCKGDVQRFNISVPDHIYAGTGSTVTVYHTGAHFVACSRWAEVLEKELAPRVTRLPTYVGVVPRTLWVITLAEKNTAFRWSMF